MSKKIKFMDENAEELNEIREKLEKAGGGEIVYQVTKKGGPEKIMKILQEISKKRKTKLIEIRHGTGAAE